MKTTERESSRFRDLCLYGDEGLRFERRPMLEGTFTESQNVAFSAILKRR